MRCHLRQNLSFKGTSLPTWRCIPPLTTSQMTTSNLTLYRILATSHLKFPLTESRSLSMSSGDLGHLAPKWIRGIRTQQKSASSGFESSVFAAAIFDIKFLYIPAVLLDVLTNKLIFSWYNSPELKLKL